jgi:hypothetical protein
LEKSGVCSAEFFSCFLFIPFSLPPSSSSEFFHRLHFSCNTPDTSIVVVQPSATIINSNTVILDHNFRSGCHFFFGLLQSSSWQLSTCIITKKKVVTGLPAIAFVPK